MAEDPGTEVVLYHAPAQALARFGEARAVRILQQRIMALDHRPNKLNGEEALLLAQASFYYDLDPFLGEIWAWVQVRGQERKLTIMRGRMGNLRKAEENARAAGTYLLPPRFKLLTDEVRRRELGVKDGDLAYECWQEDYASTQGWLTQRLALRDEKLKATEIDERVGAQAPADWGLGVLTLEEMKELDTNSKNKMTHTERAQKRARRMALAARWLAGRGQEAPPEPPKELDSYAIEAEWRVTDDEESTRRKGARAADGLYGTRPEVVWPERPFETGELVKRFIEDKIKRHHESGRTATEKQRGLMRGMLTKLFEFDDTDEKEVVAGRAHSFIRYTCGVESSKDLTGPQMLAILDWLEVSRPAGSESFVPCEAAFAEAKLVLHAALVDAGQQELPL